MKSLLLLARVASIYQLMLSFYVWEMGDMNIFLNNINIHNHVQEIH